MGSARAPKSTHLTHRSSRTPDSSSSRSAYLRTMARPKAETRETFLVEHYRPGLTADELGALAGRVRDTTVEMAREGKPVRYLRATIVPTDEALLCVFEAGSEQLVREAYARAAPDRGCRPSRSPTASSRCRRSGTRSDEAARVVDAELVLVPHPDEQLAFHVGAMAARAAPSSMRGCGSALMLQGDSTARIAERVVVSPHPRPAAPQARGRENRRA